MGLNRASLLGCCLTGTIRLSLAACFLLLSTHVVIWKCWIHTPISCKPCTLYRVALFGKMIEINARSVANKSFFLMFCRRKCDSVFISKTWQYEKEVSHFLESYRCSFFLCTMDFWPRRWDCLYFPSHFYARWSLQGLIAPLRWLWPKLEELTPCIIFFDILPAWLCCLSSLWLCSLFIFYY